jgi:hypothetical protein
VEVALAGERPSRFKLPGAGQRYNGRCLLLQREETDKPGA